MQKVRREIECFKGLRMLTRVHREYGFSLIDMNFGISGVFNSWGCQIVQNNSVLVRCLL